MYNTKVILLQQMKVANYDRRAGKACMAFDHAKIHNVQAKRVHYKKLEAK